MGSRAPATNDDDDWSSSAERRQVEGESATAAAATDDVELATGSYNNKPSQQQEQGKRRLIKGDSRGTFRTSKQQPVPDDGGGSFFTNIAELTKEVLDMDESSNHTDAELMNTEGFVVSLFKKNDLNKRQSSMKLVETKKIGVRQEERKRTERGQRLPRGLRPAGWSYLLLLVQKNLKMLCLMNVPTIMS